MNNQTITFIEYIDALYFKKNEVLNFSTFLFHRALGKIVVFPDHINVYFTYRDDLPYEGILIPKSAVVVNGQLQKTNIEIDKTGLKENQTLGVYWNDIVYFNSGKIPEGPTSMYSEGQVFSITQNAIILKNPETMKIGSHISNPLEEIPSFVVLPFLFITGVEKYDKKL